MSIMDMFRTKPADPAPNPAANPSPTDPTAVAGNTTIPGNHAVSDGKGPVAFPAAATGDSSPLDKYKDLFQADPNAAAAPALPNYAPDPVKLQAAIKGKDFLAGLPAETLTKMQAGDGSAIATAIGHAVSNSVEMMTHVSAGIVQQAVNDTHKLYKETIIPDIIKQNNVDQALAGNNVFTNPATAPMVEGMKQQFMLKYPQATPAQIQQMANQYVNDFAGEVMKANGMTVTATPVAGKNGVKAVENWDEYFNA